VFKDTNLSLFFNNQSWYTPNSNSQIELTKKEIEIVDSLDKIEESYGEVEYSKILYKFNFNKLPLFYIGKEPQAINGEPDEFFYAGFALLDSSMKWTMNCETIPPEYIINNCISYIELIDYSDYLRLHQIEFINIDQNCIGGGYDEIIIHLEGPSDDYNDVVLGINEKGEFDVLINASATLNRIEYLNDSTLRLETRERCDFFGIGLCTRILHYNTITKKITALPLNDKYLRTIANTADYINVYSTSEAAEGKIESSIIFIIKPGTEVELIKHLGKDFCYEIKCDTIIGWMNWRDNQKFGFFWPD
jgi:hypothetical protein